MRGTIRPTTVEESIQRARSMISYMPEPPHDAGSGAFPQPIRYRLKAGYNGGFDPRLVHPASFSYGRRTPTADCVGFVAWAQGWDRYQSREFDRNKKGAIIYKGWINCDSALRAARSPNPSWFEEIEVPELGCLVVYGSIYLKRKPGDDKRKRKPGHIGIVVDPLPAEWDPEFRECWQELQVVHCSSSNDRKNGGAAIQQTSGWAWRWKRRPSKFLRYMRAAQPASVCA